MIAWTIIALYLGSTREHAREFRIMHRTLVETDDGEIAACLRTLATTDAGTGFMHEAFDVADPAQFSRPWFAWANSLFGELMLTVAAQRPGVFRLLDG